MRKKKYDRRIQKTRRSLMDALISLILEKGYESTTIQDIIDRANVGRSTFYSHYENKEHLLLSGYTDFKRLIEEGISVNEKSDRGPEINFMNLYQHVSENFRLGKAILGKKSGELFAVHLQYLLSCKILEYLKTKGQNNAKMMKLVAEAAAAAMVSLLMNWIDEDMPFGVKDMATKSQELLLNLLR